MVSAIQVEEGPRLFDTTFGFFYKAKNTNIKVVFVEKASNTQHVQFDMLENPPNNEIDTTSSWKYFSKNLSDVSFLTTAWSANTKLEWQVIFTSISYRFVKFITICFIAESSKNIRSFLLSDCSLI